MKVRSDINIKVLFSFIIMLLSVIIIFILEPQSKATTHTTETYCENSDTIFNTNVLGRNGTNTAIEITANSIDKAAFIYKYTGLNPKQFYSISAYVKVKSINCISDDYQSGAIINLTDTSASTEIINYATGWKKISYVALSGPDGTINAQFLLNNSSGDIFFDDIAINAIENDNNYKVYSYTNTNSKTGRIVFNVDNINGTSITNEEIETFLKTLLDIRNYLTNFTGNVVDDGNVDIIATNHYEDVAYVYIMPEVRTEIQWMKDCVDLNDLHNDFLNGASVPFFITHEIGHQHTSSQFNFDSEFWGYIFRINSRL